MAAKGTHVLQQVSSVQELNNLEPQLRQALGHDGITTFSVRVPWKATGSMDAIFTRGLALARASGKQFSYRVMAGEHTPDPFKGESWPTRNGLSAPMPKMSNTIFLNAYEDMAVTLGNLARSAGPDVQVMHFCGAGERWAELSNSPEVRAEVSREEFVAFHVALMDRAREAVDCDVEFPMSGRGDLVWIIGQLAQAAIPRNIIVQANGLADEVDKHWGSPDNATELAKDQAVFATNVRRACQMIQPQQYNWTQVYDNCRGPLMEGIPAEYVEVYTPSFVGSSSGLLYEEAALFFAEQGEDPTDCDELQAAYDALLANYNTVLADNQDLLTANQDLADNLYAAQVALGDANSKLDQIRAIIG